MNNCDVIELVPGWATDYVYISQTILTDINRERDVMGTEIWMFKNNKYFLGEECLI